MMTLIGEISIYPLIALLLGGTGGWVLRGRLRHQRAAVQELHRRLSGAETERDRLREELAACERQLSDLRRAGD